jgi:prephenate dehydrogenase
MTAPPFTAGATIAIVGLGLMGGSLARALRRTGMPLRIIGSSLERGAAERAVGAGVVDAAGDAASIVEAADLVVFATPVGTTIAMLADLAPRLRAALVTDVGSVKGPVMTAAAAAGLDRFAGGHPLCGSHEAGWDASRADLFDGARVWVVAGKDAHAAEQVASVWRSVGARPALIDAAAHDAEMARVSHLPQLVASALAAALAGTTTSAARLGPGGRDATRLAASPPELWADILTHNRDAVLGAATDVRRALDRLLHALATGDADGLVAELRAARDWRTRA